MQISLRLEKAGVTVYEGTHDVNDADGFGAAFAAVWQALHDRKLQEATSVGQLMEIITEDVLDEVNGCSIGIGGLSKDPPSDNR
jgi:hypothetical protein